MVWCFHCAFSVAVVSVFGDFQYEWTGPGFSLQSVIIQMKERPTIRVAMFFCFSLNLWTDVRWYVWGWRRRPKKPKILISLNFLSFGFSALPQMCFRPLVLHATFCLLREHGVQFNLISACLFVAASGIIVTHHMEIKRSFLRREYSFFVHCGRTNTTNAPLPLFPMPFPFFPTTPCSILIALLAWRSSLILIFHAWLQV